MKQIVRCDKDDYMVLSDIWERSVRVSHDFLTEDVIKEIKEVLVPEYFPNVDLFAVTDNGDIAGFVGLSDEKIEMLFVDSDRRGYGYGSKMIEFAKQHGVTLVDVNEQNASAVKFYESKGFRIIGRDKTDEAGRPYPILHMSL